MKRHLLFDKLLPPDADMQQHQQALLDHVKTNTEHTYWDDEKSYPLVSHTDSQYAIRMVKLPDPPRNMVEMPAIDRARVDGIRKAGLITDGVLEVDQFYAPVTVGKKHERKACMSVALATDAKTGFVHAPNVDSPGDHTGGAMSDVLLSAIEAARTIPVEVRVRDRDKKQQLDRLARELGFRLRASESLPALDAARDALIGAMQGPGI